MHCYSCKKSFDYEKYYGICPKCGYYNKKETEEEQHQQCQERHDGGRTYGESSAYKPEKTHSITRIRLKGADKFLMICVLITYFIFVGSVIINIFCNKALESKEREIQESVMGKEAPLVGHIMGEEFSLGSINLRVKGAKVLATDEELNIPAGKQLIAIQISARGNGKWEDGNILSEMSILCNDSFYWQISARDFAPYGNAYHCPALDRYILCKETEAEGWVAFLTDEGVESVTLCAEERTGEDQMYLEAIHVVKILLEE